MLIKTERCLLKLITIELKATNALFSLSPQTHPRPLLARLFIAFTTAGLLLFRFAALIVLLLHPTA